MAISLLSGTNLGNFSQTHYSFNNNLFLFSQVSQAKGVVESEYKQEPVLSTFSLTEQVLAYKDRIIESVNVELTIYY